MVAQMMNNEPVAWINKDEYHEWLNWDKNTTMPSNIPLYTHPAKELTLTEDEIDDVWAGCSTGESEFIDMHLFAEAILKKAHKK